MTVVFLLGNDFVVSVVTAGRVGLVATEVLLGVVPGEAFVTS